MTIISDYDFSVQGFFGTKPRPGVKKCCTLFMFWTLWNPNPKSLSGKMVYQNRIQQEADLPVTEIIIFI